MVTKAQIEKIISENEVQIKVPMFGMIEEEADEEEVNDLPNARICTTPGCSPNYKKGDVVLICIEDNDLTNPIIMGKFIPDNNTVGTSDANFDILKVLEETTLSKKTTIGKVLPENIEHLEKSKWNLQLQFDTNTNQKIEVLNFLTDSLNQFKFT